jgi:hypothetical protein
MGLISGIAKLTLGVAAIAVAGPLVAPLLMAGDWDGIDGYSGGSDDE